MIRLKEKYQKAIKLRKAGFSLNEISEKVVISKSTASFWLKNIKLSNQAKTRLIKRGIFGREKSKLVQRRKRENFEKIISEKSKSLVRDNLFSKDHQKIICALLYWCEGAKSPRKIQFTNSDPKLIKTFVFLLRSAFDIDEKNFRVALHLHEYHSIQKQILFWSKVTGIKKSQFIKPYQKPHTAKRIKEGYPGCVNVCYYDTSFAKEILYIAKAFLNIHGRVG